MQLTQGLRRAEFLFPSRSAVICEDRQSSWRDVAQRVSRIASGLVQQGIRKGDRVAILALNSDRHIEAYYAIAWAGAVSVPFNTRWAKAEFEFAMADSQPTILLADKHFMTQARSLAGPECRLIGMDRETAETTFDRLIEGMDPMPDRSGVWRRSRRNFLHRWHHGSCQRCDAQSCKSDNKFFLARCGCTI